MERKSQDLSSGWTLSLLDGQAPESIGGVKIPAKVPGTVHTDLLEAGLIPDPYWGENEKTLEWIWRSTWLYQTEFQACPPQADECVELVFEGLDTVAKIELNGVEIASTKNMHRSYRFNVGQVLVAGTNTLSVTFYSALDYAERVQNDIGFRPSPYPHPYHAIRKMACSFGWDWGPNLQTAGIWKAIRLERWHTTRLETVRPLVRLNDIQANATPPATATVEVYITLARPVEHPVTVHATLAGSEALAEFSPRQTQLKLTLTPTDFELWWPQGYGESPLYELVVLVRSGQLPLDEARCRIGFRAIELDTHHEGEGAGFTLRVNERALFVKGANWIPDDHLMTRLSKSRLRTRLSQAIDANMNLLRVWGGGVYESEDFYDLCDEMGLLVWQDFLFACAAYHEGSPLHDEIVAEARENVTRLLPHPSLILYNGSNENIWGYCDWGWPEAMQPDASWGLKYYEQVLPSIVAELDPTRPYIPSSPFSPHHSHEEVHPNDPAWGPIHEWDVWNRVDYKHYRDLVPRFCAEFGFQGPATWATLKHTLPPEALDQTHPAWLLHQKADDGNAKLNRGFAPHLPPCRDFESWHWTTALNQARAIQTAVEHYRSFWPTCAGAIVWQLNDCWPVTSWACIDGEGRKKPLWYALQHAYAPRLLTFQPRSAAQSHAPDGQPHLIAVNDSDEVWTDTLSVVRLSLDGHALATKEIRLSLGARRTMTFALPEALIQTDTPNAEILVATASHQDRGMRTRAVWSFAEDRDIDYEAAPFTADARKVASGYEVTVQARHVVRELTLLADKVTDDAEVDSALVTLLPGESHTFRISTITEVNASLFLAPTVLLSVNRLVAD